jgi:hypothetical protein
VHRLPQFGATGNNVLAAHKEICRRGIDSAPRNRTRDLSSTGNMQGEGDVRRGVGCTTLLQRALAVSTPAQTLKVMPNFSSLLV